MEDARIQNVDPETAFLASKRQTGNEWELFKENVRPLKRGRNVNLLNDALKSHTDNHLKKSLLDKRRKLIEAIDDYKGDDPLQSWLECIKWVQEAFPPGGECSGLLVIYEQCVRAFWHSDRYKDDLRYLKVWLEYADNCSDAEVIYNFLDANEIGKSHSLFYISYALHMEAKNKMKTANEILNLGISRNAQPIKKLEDAYRKFLARSMRRPLAVDEEKAENGPPARSFGTVLAKGEKTRQATLSSDHASRKQKAERVPLAICKDTNIDKSSSHQPEISKKVPNFWNNLGGRAERNKENNAQPTKWTSYKIPQKLGQRTGVAAPSACIEVFVDEECAETAKGGGKSSTLELRQGDGKGLKEATELLRENPLRNFPPNSLPR